MINIFTRTLFAIENIDTRTPSMNTTLKNSNISGELLRVAMCQFTNPNCGLFQHGHR